MADQPTTTTPATADTTPFQQMVKQLQQQQATQGPLQASPHPCPSCGHCPTCGRGGYAASPFPWRYPAPYFHPYVTYGTYGTTQWSSGQIEQILTTTTGPPTYGQQHG